MTAPCLLKFSIPKASLAPRQRVKDWLTLDSLQGLIPAKRGPAACFPGGH